ncbi:hypothetical protein GCM10010411_64290 [Actinomadura fulvescens]|uniref:Uncharacterized protein n=1 Tax=Actinomadura fulvescens TaxID=46160 RepID=A0ABP6CK33_9ACTN
MTRPGRPTSNRTFPPATPPATFRHPLTAINYHPKPQSKIDLKDNPTTDFHSTHRGPINRNSHNRHTSNKPPPNKPRDPTRPITQRRPPVPRTAALPDKQQNRPRAAQPLRTA